MTHQTLSNYLCLIFLSIWIIMTKLNIQQNENFKRGRQTVIFQRVQVKIIYIGMFFVLLIFFKAKILELLQGYCFFIKVLLYLKKYSTKIKEFIKALLILDKNFFKMFILNCYGQSIQMSHSVFLFKSQTFTFKGIMMNT